MWIPEIVAVVLLAICGTSAAQVPNTQGSLRPGTIVPLRLVAALDAAHASPGDLVHMVVVSDISMSGVTVVTQGTPALGEVIAVHHRGIFGRGASITISVLEIQPGGRDPIPLTAVRTTKAHGRVGAMFAGALAAGLVISGEAAPLAALIPGSDVKMPLGTEFLARVAASPSTAPAAVDVPLGGAATVTPKRELGPRAAGVTRLAVSSSPAPATVSLDGAALGATPLTTVIADGQHIISVSSPGHNTVSERFVASGKRISFRYALALSARGDSLLERMLAAK